MHHKVNQGYTLEKIFASMELEDMLERCIEEIKRGGYKKSSELTDKNVEAVKGFLMRHWTEVLEHYEEQLEAGKMYYSEVLKGCHRVAAVDVGWAGSGAVALDYIVNQIWGLDCEVIGLLAGTNSAHNAEPNMSEPQLWNGKLVSYLFSQGHNRDIWKFHDPGKGHNILIEMLLCSVETSFLKFNKKGEKIEIIYRNHQDYTTQKVKYIQEGILDYCIYWPKKIISDGDVGGIFMLMLSTDRYLELLKRKINIEINL